jgi:hypothetical protein
MSKKLFWICIVILLLVVTALFSIMIKIMFLPVRTGYDNGIGWAPLVEVQGAQHHEVDPVLVLLDHDFPIEDYFLPGEKTVVSEGDLVIGDVTLTNTGKRLYDDDPFMRTFIMHWFDCRTEITAGNKPMYVLRSVTEVTVRKIVGIMAFNYNYQTTEAVHYPSGEVVEGYWSEQQERRKWNEEKNK